LKVFTVISDRSNYGYDVTVLAAKDLEQAKELFFNKLLKPFGGLDIANRLSVNMDLPEYERDKYKRALATAERLTEDAEFEEHGVDSPGVLFEDHSGE
jgi:hypothetical protein